MSLTQLISQHTDLIALQSRQRRSTFLSNTLAALLEEWDDDQLPAMIMMSQVPHSVIDGKMTKPCFGCHRFQVGCRPTPYCGISSSLQVSRVGKQGIDEQMAYFNGAAAAGKDRPRLLPRLVAESCASAQVAFDKIWRKLWAITVPGHLDSMHLYIFIWEGSIP